MKIGTLSFLLFLFLIIGTVDLYSREYKAPTNHFIGIKVGLGVSNFIYSKEILGDETQQAYKPGLVTSVDIIYDLDFKGRFYSLFAQVGLSIYDFYSIDTDELYRLQYGVFAIGMKIFFYKGVYFGFAPYFGLLINGQNTHAGDNKILSINNYNGLNIQVFSNSAKYYFVKLIGIGGTYKILNYYSPNGNIRIPADVTSKYKKKSYASIYVSPHCVYIARKFEVPKYINGTKQISMISVKYGWQVVMGSHITFR